MTTSIMMLSIMTFSLKKLSIMTLSIMTLSIMMLSVMTFSIMTLSMAFIIIMNKMWHSAIMLRLTVLMLSVWMLSVGMLSVTYADCHLCWVSLNWMLFCLVSWHPILKASVYHHWSAYYDLSTYDCNWFITFAPGSNFIKFATLITSAQDS
jgi:hypothetical protein